MKIAAFLLAIGATAALANPIVERKAAPTITFEYYPAAGCKTGGVTTTVSTCTNLKFAANSFKVTGKTKLPNGCTLKGFESASCKGFEVQYIDGPSFDKCDAAANSSGKFKSVQINCD